MAQQNEPGVPNHNRTVTVLASDAYLTDQAVTVFNPTNKGVIVFLNVSAKTLSPTSLTLSIKHIDPVSSGVSSAILSGAAVTDTGLYVYTIYPGLGAVTNAIANNVIGPKFQVAVVGSGVDASNYFTYSISACMVI